MEDLHNVKQKPSEEERALLARIGNYLMEEKLAAIFMPALSEATRLAVTSYRDDNRDADLETLVCKADAIGSANYASKTSRTAGVYASVSILQRQKAGAGACTLAQNGKNAADMSQPRRAPIWQATSRWSRLTSSPKPWLTTCRP